MEADEPTGDAELLVAARAALLDALDALAAQRDALVLIGAQANYLHTGAPRLRSPRQPRTATSRSIPGARRRPAPRRRDDRRGLPPRPRLSTAGQLALAHRHSRRSHGARGAGRPAVAAARGSRPTAVATRRTPGLEAAVVDYAPMTMVALAPGDDAGDNRTSPGRRRCSSPSFTSSASDATTPAVSSTRTPTTSTACWSPYRPRRSQRSSPPFARMPSPEL